MSKIYAVCIDSYIDGGAPGYYAIAMCETKKEAETIKSFVNSCIKTINNTQFGTRKHWEACQYLREFDNHELSFGYYEGIDSEATIKEINVIEPGEFWKIYYKFNEDLKHIRKTFADKNGGKVDYSDWRINR